jgi:hypothetical protein
MMILLILVLLGLLIVAGFIVMDLIGEKKDETWWAICIRCTPRTHLPVDRRQTQVRLTIRGEWISTIESVGGYAADHSPVLIDLRPVPLPERRSQLF